MNNFQERLENTNAVKKITVKKFSDGWKTLEEGFPIWNCLEIKNDSPAYIALEEARYKNPGALVILK